MPKELKEKIEDWEKEFDEKIKDWTDYAHRQSWEYEVASVNWEAIKSFIRQLLSQEKQKWVKKRNKIITEPIKVDFYTKDSKKVTFKGYKTRIKKKSWEEEIENLREAQIFKVKGGSLVVGNANAGGFEGKSFKIIRVLPSLKLLIVRSTENDDFLWVFNYDSIQKPDK